MNFLKSIRNMVLLATLIVLGTEAVTMNLERFLKKGCPCQNTNKWISGVIPRAITVVDTLPGYTGIVVLERKCSGNHKHIWESSDATYSISYNTSAGIVDLKTPYTNTGVTYTRNNVWFCDYREINEPKHLTLKFTVYGERSNYRMQFTEYIIAPSSIGGPTDQLKNDFPLGCTVSNTYKQKWRKNHYNTGKLRQKEQAKAVVIGYAPNKGSKEQLLVFWISGKKKGNAQVRGFDKWSTPVIVASSTRSPPAIKRSTSNPVYGTSNPKPTMSRNTSAPPRYNPTPTPTRVSTSVGTPRSNAANIHPDPKSIPTINNVKLVEQSPGTYAHWPVNTWVKFSDNRYWYNGRTGFETVSDPRMAGWKKGTADGRTSFWFYVYPNGKIGYSTDGTHAQNTPTTCDYAEAHQFKRRRLASRTLMDRLAYPSTMN